MNILAQFVIEVARKHDTLVAHIYVLLDAYKRLQLENYLFLLKRITFYLRGGRFSQCCCKCPKLAQHNKLSFY